MRAEREAKQQTDPTMTNPIGTGGVQIPDVGGPLLLSSRAQFVGEL
jgi:hypothetical protein